MGVLQQSGGLNAWDNHEELIKFIMLQRCLKEHEVERMAENGNWQSG
jgi:hypothetical protein